MTSQQVKNLTKEYIASTYKRNDIAIAYGKGARGYDFEGRKYIDFSSGIGVNSLGYSNEKWANAVSEQAKKLNHTSNLFYTEPAASLAETLVTASGMSKVFFANSGAEANEGAIKAARKYSFDKYGDKERMKIITLNRSFHGRTVTTLAATGQEHFHNFFFPFTEGFVYAEPNNLAEIKGLLDGKVCAILLEGIQGEGGINPLDYSYVQGINGLRDKEDILLIFDEVQTGIGRTGKLFSYMDYDLLPDIVSAAKGLGGGLPIGAVLFSEKIKDVMGYGSHGSTFGGNPIAAAGGKVVLEEILAKGFLDDVIQKGEYIKEKILSFGEGVITGAKGKGLMLGFTLKEGVINSEIISLLLENGLLILSSGQNMLRLLPPLNISYEEIDEGLEIFKKVLDEVKKK